ncbi:MAG: shikimate dehydrogenase [Ruminococcaceae bacterium]|nr:shikimate dehydrogenase [Oscillospiraceae bacterium]
MKYGLIANRVTHSFSAEIHKKLFGYDYELKALSENQLHQFLSEREFSAINVTIPYKESVIPYLDYIHPVAKSIGAVNTIVNRDGRLYGYNTDAGGLTALIQTNGISLKDKKVLVLGSGGTSKTALYVAKQLGAREVFRVSRNEKDGCISYETALSAHNNSEVIINTTPCGMFPETDATPININAFPSLSAVIDVIYNPLKTKLVCQAQKKKIKAVGGLYMLVAQAALAAELFVDKSVEEIKIKEVYRQILKSKQNIVLTGMPGCGKSSAGKYVAKKLGARFIDTDDKITQQTGASPSEIINFKGEQAFRDIESDIIKEISQLNGCVISTGGGAVLREENIENLLKNGRIYFINRPLEDIKISDDRPLSSTRELLKKRFEERYDIYCNSADVIINPLDGAELNADLILEDFNENSCN